MSKKLTTADFIERSKLVHGDKYDYSKSEYTGKDNKLIIICKTHGEFMQSPNNHWKGKGCPKCSGNAKMNIQDFILQAKRIHNDKYDYSKVVYKNIDSPVTIICKEHGEFMQTPYKHLHGRGCPKCGIEKMKQTNLCRYGFEYAIASQSVRDKIKNTCMDKYGVENPGGLKETQDKIINTNILKFGVPYAVSSTVVRNKSRKTLMKHYGVTSPFKSDTIRQRARETMVQRYGVIAPIQNKTIRDKTIKTNMTRYGENFPLQSTAIQSKCQTSLMCNYNVTNPMQSNVIRQKVQNTKRENNTFNTSEPEEKLYLMLVKKFGKENILRQYKSTVYPFACDFYIKSIDTYIELNASWTHNDHFFNSDDESDLQKVKDWELKSINSPFYKSAIDTWTRRDVIKYKTAADNNINYVVFWNNDLSDAINWLNNYDTN